MNDNHEQTLNNPIPHQYEGCFLFSLAGVWRHWESTDGNVIESCSIVTTEANAVLKQLRDRMSVIVRPDDY